MTKPRTRVNLGRVYLPKTCVHCNSEYVPTSGRQNVCTSEECRKWKERNYPSRKNGRYVKRGERPSRKKCEWPDCIEVFAVAPTGLVPRYCVIHTRDAANAYSIVSRKNWERKTLDTECRYPDCTNNEHTRARGWCYRHYPIWSVHGVDADKWWQMFNDQNGTCPICEQALFDGRIVVVDHDHLEAEGPRHDVKHVRGLLHSAPCNGMILGGIETAISKGWFQNALLYIKYPPSELN